jgi:hypothetical protein
VGGPVGPLTGKLVFFLTYLKGDAVRQQLSRTNAGPSSGVLVGPPSVELLYGRFDRVCDRVKYILEYIEDIVWLIVEDIHRTVFGSKT